MTVVKTDLGNTRESARRLRFEPVGALTETNVQKAIEQVATTPQGIVETDVSAGMSPYAVQSTDTVLYVDTSGGPVQILLQPSVARLGVPLFIKDVSGDAATNNITITPSGAETVDELAPYLIVTDFGRVRLNPITGGYAEA